MLYALAIPFVVSSFSSAASGSFIVGSEYVFMLLFVIAGALTGIEFPVAGRLHLECTGRVGGTSGAVDGSDHAGAFLGSLLTGVILVPLLGTTSACVIIAAINAASAALLLVLIINRRMCKSQT